MRDKNPEVKLQAAYAYFEKKDYFRSSMLFEDVLPFYRATQESQDIYYFLAECKFNTTEYDYAAILYKNYIETFPNGKYYEAANFRFALCNYVESFPPELDPTNTHRAIENLQLFINVFPSSPYIDTCNKLIDLCRAKMEKKAYDNAYMYYNIQNYKSSMVSFKNFIRDFPETDRMQESIYYMVRSAYLLALNSVEEKKKDRLRDVIKMVADNESEMRSSKYHKELQEMRQEADDRLQNMN